MSATAQQFHVSAQPIGEKERIVSLDVLRGFEMREQGFISIDHLQQHEVGDLGNSLGARIGHPSSERLAAVMEQALDLGEEAGEVLRSGAVERRRDEGLVEHVRHLHGERQAVHPARH